MDYAGGNLRIHDLFGGPEYPEHVMQNFSLNYSGTPKYRNMLGNSLPVGPAKIKKIT